MAQRKDTDPNHLWDVATVHRITAADAATAARYGQLYHDMLDPGGWSTALDVYCFAGETEYITREGIRRFDETAGTSQLVLTEHFGRGDRTRRHNGNGRWVEAEIVSFGEQPLLTVTLTRNRTTKTIRATPDHRWFASANEGGQSPLREYTTADLRPGYALGTLTPRLSTRQSLPSPFGIAHGIVYGDGSRNMNRGVHDGCKIDLWGQKDAQLLRYFNDAPTRPMKLPTGVEGIRVLHLPNAFKARPELSESVPYLYGWLAGYFAADGSVSRTGGVKLSSARRDDLEFAQAIATRLGLATYSIRSASRIGYGTEASDLFNLPFVQTCLRPEFFLIAEHRRRFEETDAQFARLGWRVVSVEDHGEAEEVFCATVPDTNTFALADFIWTHNCGQCHRPYDDVGDQPCEAAQGWDHLVGGPLGRRKRLHDHDCNRFGCNPTLTPVQAEALRRLAADPTPYRTDPAPTKFRKAL